MSIDFLTKDQLPGSSMMKTALNSNVWALWTIRIILVIYASFGAPNLNKAGALFFNNMIVRLVLAILIIYLCYVDPASAILLAVSLVVSVQTLNKYRVSSISDDNESFGATSSSDSSMNTSEPYANESFTQDMGSSEETPVMTNDSDTFTKQEQLEDAQTNQVQDDQASQVQTWKNELGPQGLNEIPGFNVNNDADPLRNAAQF